MTGTAGRSAATATYAQGLLTPDVLVADTSQVAVPASYLGVETNGKIVASTGQFGTGGLFGGRGLTDDVIAANLGLAFGNTAAQLGGAPDDGDEQDGRSGRPTLSNDSCRPGKPCVHDDVPVSSRAALTDEKVPESKNRSMAGRLPPIGPWGCSSAGRALASHVRGREFESPHLHQNKRRFSEVFFGVGVFVSGDRAPILTTPSADPQFGGQHDRDHSATSFRSCRLRVGTGLSRGGAGFSDTKSLYDKWCSAS